MKYKSSGELTCEILVLEAMHKDAGEEDEDTSSGRHHHSVDVYRIRYDNLNNFINFRLIANGNNV